MSSHILYDASDSIATITLNRPEARNAYSSEMAESLVDALDQADENDDIRAVIVTGAGDAFCAGGDIKAMRDRTGMFSGDPVELRKNYLEGLHKVPQRFQKFEKPTLAAINGPAIGAGLDLSLMCDIRIASADATFGSTFARVGVIPGDGGAYLLQRVVGFPKALELILTAKLIDASEADEIGLVNHVEEPDEVMERTLDMAEQIASLPPKAVQLAKTAVYRAADSDFDSAMELTAALQALVQHTDEHEQAVRDVIDSLQ